MTDKIIDLDLIDEGNDGNIFDNLMSTIEKLSISGAASKEYSKKFEDIVLSIERKVQDLSDVDDTKASGVYIQLRNVMTEYKNVIIHDNSSEMLNNTIYALSTINNSIYDYKNLPRIINQLSIKRNLHGNEWSLENIKKASFIGLASLDYDTININKLISEKFIDSWNIDMVFKTLEYKGHKPLEFIYQFAEILNNIEGVKIEIEKIEKGSIITRIKAFFTTEKSKKNAADVLESARKFAEGRLEKDYEEKEKMKSEKEKIELEKQILQQEIDENTNLDSLYLTAIHIKQAEEDLKRKKLENIKLSLEVLKDSRELFTELLAEGFVSQDDFKILINEIPFLEKIDGKLTIGESIEIKNLPE